MGAWENWQKLQETHEAARTLEWENQAMGLLPELSYKILFKEAKQGKDGWPYLWVTPQPGVDGERLSHIFKWLVPRGIGLVIQSEGQSDPDFVFSYGMCWNYLESGHFIVEGGSPSGEMAFKDGQTAWVGSPSESYLPPYAREVLRKFLLDQAVLKPKILMVSQDKKNFDLAFSVESFGNPEASEWQGVLEALSWFLPTHYSLAFLSEKVFNHFEDL